jgi:hypothetical protein
MSTVSSLHNKPVVAGADTLAGSDAVRAPTPATTPTAAPEASARPVEQPDAGPVPPTGPASTFDPLQYARNAAADLAYPDEKNGIKTGRLWGYQVNTNPPTTDPYYWLVRKEVPSTSWMAEQAACTGADPDLFFSFKDRDIQQAKAICADCPIRERCLEHAVAYEDAGTWGGYTAEEREFIRKGHQPAAATELVRMKRAETRRRRAEASRRIQLEKSGDHPHGTYAGYKRHVRQRSEVCDDCLTAMREYNASKRPIKRETGGMSGADILDIRRGA